MDERDAGTRCVRDLVVDGQTRQVIEAWHGRCGHTLVYFLPDDARALLSPGRALADLGPDELSELYGEAVPLTDTERRFAGADDRLWLAQSSGPVWAGSEVGESLGGVVVTSLSGPFERHTLQAAVVAGMDESRLATVVAEARPTPAED